jgi:hypothetical protein
LIEPKLSDTIKRERAKRMDAIYRGEISPDSEDLAADLTGMNKPMKKETTKEMLSKLQSLEGLM